jgi:hypothetical protein
MVHPKESGRIMEEGFVMRRQEGLFHFVRPGCFYVHDSGDILFGYSPYSASQIIPCVSIGWLDDIPHCAHVNQLHQKEIDKHGLKQLITP